MTRLRTSGLRRNNQNQTNKKKSNSKNNKVSSFFSSPSSILGLCSGLCWSSSSGDRPKIKNNKSSQQSSSRRRKLSVIFVFTFFFIVIIIICTLLLRYHVDILHNNSTRGEEDGLRGGGNSTKTTKSLLIPPPPPPPPPPHAEIPLIRGKPAAALMLDNNNKKDNVQEITTRKPPPKIFHNYQYVHTKQFTPQVVEPWSDWKPCVQQEAFTKFCFPRKANCTAVHEEVMNNHGIGNALIVTYEKVARESLQASPYCAPIIRDKLRNQGTSPGIYNFKLLDYVEEPKWVVPIIRKDPNAPIWSPPTAKTQSCVLYTITRPKPIVATKIQQVFDKLHIHHHNQNNLVAQPATEELPLVTIHIRTGWSDELERNAQAWLEGLGHCHEEYGDFDLDLTPLAVNEINLRGMILDTAHAADTMFGYSRWKLYVASDAPGIRRYTKYIVLQNRTATLPIVWNDGKVGHNYNGGALNNYEEKVETSVSAFVDVLVMSQASLLVSLSSKFPRASEMITQCPQRAIHLAGHPRHGLARTGGILQKLWNLQKQKHPTATATANKGGPWIPEFTDAEMEVEFYEGLPMGKNNPCLLEHNPIRSCYCMLKQGHQ